MRCLIVGKDNEVSIRYGAVLKGMRFHYIIISDYETIRDTNEWNSHYIYSQVIPSLKGKEHIEVIRDSKNNTVTYKRKNEVIDGSLSRVPQGD